MADPHQLTAKALIDMNMDFARLCVTCFRNALDGGSVKEPFSSLPPSRFVGVLLYH